jgi:hypothetical protein
MEKGQEVHFALFIYSLEHGHIPSGQPHTLKGWCQKPPRITLLWKEAEEGQDQLSQCPHLHWYLSVQLPERGRASPQTSAQLQAAQNAIDLLDYKQKKYILTAPESN